MAEKSASTEVSLGEALRRAFRGRCPRCGQGALFTARFRLHSACSSCEMPYRREQGAMTGQMVLSAVLTEIFAVLVSLALFFLTDLDRSQGLLIGVPTVVGFSYWCLPRMMAAWVAIEFFTDAVSAKVDRTR